MTGGHLTLSPAVGWVDAGDTVYAALLPDGPPLVLVGSGALVWRALVAGGTDREVVARVADAAGESAEVVGDGVLGFVDGLVAAGLVSRE